jgi:hypothetical protein
VEDIVHYALSSDIAAFGEYGDLLFACVTRCEFLPFIADAAGSGNFCITSDPEKTTCKVCLKKTADSPHFHTVALEGKLVSHTRL